MTLEEQLSVLAELGLKLNEGISVDDMLYSFGREDYESNPFEMVLFVLGIEVEREPWGRAMCNRAWNFDTECITSTGDYVQVLHNLCRVPGTRVVSAR